MLIICVGKRGDSVSRVSKRVICISNVLARGVICVSNELTRGVICVSEVSFTENMV